MKASIFTGTATLGSAEIGMVSDFDTLFQDQAIPTLRDQFGDVYTLRRGGLTAAITAEMAPHEEEESDERNVRTAWRGVKFTLRAADYVFGSDLALPIRGDEFVHGNEDGTKTVYAVLPPKGKKCFGKIDADGYELLIYAKEFGTE